MKKEEKTPEIKAVNAVDEAVDKIIQEIEDDEEENEHYTCCNVEITDEIRDIGLCPKCLEHI